MFTPFRLKGNPHSNLNDPLSSDQCEIIQQIFDECEPIGGYYLLEIEHLPIIHSSPIAHSYEKILHLLGINHI